jgi:hypothetical protein
VLTPDGHLLIVDFGHFELLGEGQVETRRGSGKPWKVGLN